VNVILWSFWFLCVCFSSDVAINNLLLFSIIFFKSKIFKNKKKIIILQLFHSHHLQKYQGLKETHKTKEGSSNMCDITHLNQLKVVTIY
jgi:hypothetical protein